MTKTIATVLVVVATFAASAAAQDTTMIKISEDVPALEFVGQFNNVGPSSQQFGYISNISGFSPVFNGTPRNESTANFTFVTHATTTAVFVNGPFKTVDRTGTTTIYLNSGPSDFSDPGTFSQGTPIQVSTYTQQVILNTVTGAFSTVHLNSITASKSFLINGISYQLGQVGKSFRTTYLGQVNPVAGTTPSGWFGGYAAGVK
jgi:hypothetical protein